jgi:hypothetical protein
MCLMCPDTRNMVTVGQAASPSGVVAAGVQDRVRIIFCDYRDVADTWSQCIAVYCSHDCGAHYIEKCAGHFQDRMLFDASSQMFWYFAQNRFKGIMASSKLRSFAVKKMGTLFQASAAVEGKQPHKLLDRLLEGSCGRAKSCETDGQWVARRSLAQSSFPKQCLGSTKGYTILLQRCNNIFQLWVLHCKVDWNIQQHFVLMKQTDLQQPLRQSHTVIPNKGEQPAVPSMFQ